MPTYYLDLDTQFANHTGADSSGNEYYGPGGFMAAINGWGLATALAADDVLNVTGTGYLTRLVKVTADADKSATWLAGDDIQNHNDGGGANGDNWNGILVRCEATTLWVELDSGGDEDDVDTADGIYNITRTDDLAGVNMTAKACPGIQVDVADGNLGAGDPIFITGVNASWTNDGTYAVFDGGGDAVNCIKVSNKDSYIWENIDCTNSTGDVWASTATSANHFFLHCRGRSSAAGDGWGDPWGSCRAFNCVAENNAGSGFNSGVGRMDCVGCMSSGNGTYGYRGNQSAMVGCIAHNNSDTGVRDPYGPITAVNCVADGNPDGFGLSVGGLLFRCRITNSSSGGIDVYGGGTVYAIDCYFDSNGANTIGDVVVTSYQGAETAVTGGIVGYEDLANDKFNLILGAAGYRKSLDIDGNSNYVSPMGLPAMIIPKIGDEG